MKQWAMWKTTGWLVVIWLVLVAGCSSNDDGDQNSDPVSTPGPVVWQRPQVAISQDTSLQVHLTGVMRLHQRTVNDLTFSASGIRLASVGADQTTVVWNMANGESLFVYSGADVRQVFFGPGDETLITVGRDGVARVWLLDMQPPRELQEVATFPQAGDDITAVSSIVAQSPDQSLLAFGTENGRIRLWRVPAGELVADFEGHTDLVQNLVFSPDGTLLASTSLDRTVRVWSVPDAEELYDLTDPQERPLRAVFSPDSTYLAVANRSGIHLWNMETGETVFSTNAADYTAANALVFSPDGRWLAGCGQQPSVAIWEVATGQLMPRLPLREPSCTNLAFSPDSTLLLTLPSPGRDVYLWNLSPLDDYVAQGQELYFDRADRTGLGLFPGASFYDVAWSGDGRFIIVVDELGPLYVLSAAQ